MNVILFGGTGMVGQGVLRECLLFDGVGQVLAVGRTPIGRKHEKLREIVRSDLFDLAPVETDKELSGYDACFFCLGVSSFGMSEAAYTKVTHDLTLSVAATLARRNPGMTFVYVSGAGTDSTERGRTMWARVKGRTENALLKLPFKAAYMFRPAYIQPMHGVVSKTGIYRLLYAGMAPLYPVWNALLPRRVTTTEKVGRAMLAVARRGAPKPILENDDINALSGAATARSGTA